MKHSKAGNIAAAVAMTTGLWLASAPVAAAEAEEAGRQANLEHLAEQHHVEIGAGVTIVGQGVSDAPSGSDGGVTYSVDIALESEVGELGTAFVYLNTSQGTGVSAAAPWGGFNADNEAGDPLPGALGGGYDDTRVAEAWLKIPLGGEFAALTIGKIDAAGIFDTNEYANDETAQFLGDPFVNNLAIGLPGYTLGANLEITAVENLTLNLGAFEAQDDFVGANNSSVLLAEAAYGHGLLGGGNARLTYWQAEDNSAPSVPGDEVDANGFAINIDQVVAEGAGVFLRYGSVDDSSGVNVAWDYDAALSFGGQYKVGPGVVGAGYSILTAANTGAEDEAQFEVYYRHEISDSVHVTADVQMMTDAGGVAGDDVTVYGLRMQTDL